MGFGAIFRKWAGGWIFIGIVIVILYIAVAIIWLALAMAIPLIMIDVAVIALIVGLIRKDRSRFPFTLSVAGAVLVVADYKQRWFTKALATNVSFLAWLVPVLLSVNILAGLISVYFLIRISMNKRN
jgi:hypothetical protein